MSDYADEFKATRTGEIAVGVFIALVAFKLTTGIIRACFE